MTAALRLALVAIAVAANAQKQPVWWQCAPCGANDQLYQTLRRTTVVEQVPLMGQMVRMDRGGLVVATARELAAVVNSNYQYAPILVARVLQPANTWVVALSGMQQFRDDQATGLRQALAAAVGAPTEYSDLIMRAWFEMRIPPESRILLTGHSLGGMESENLLFHPQHGPKARSQVQRIVTFGAPATRYLSIDVRDIRRFMYINDPVLPALRETKVATSHLSERFLTMVPYTRGSGDVHNSYHYGPVLDGYDAFGDRITTRGAGRTLILDTRAIWRCRANISALAYEHDSTSRDLANPRGVPEVTNQRDRSGVATGYYSSFWPDAPRANLGFHFSNELYSARGPGRRARGSGLAFSMIDRAGQSADPRLVNPPYSASRMMVDSMRALRSTMPWFIRFENIVEERSVGPMDAGRPQQAPVYRVLMGTLRELRAKDYTIEYGLSNGPSGRWMQAEIRSYFD
jgi:hypothetical protein